MDGAINPSDRTDWVHSSIESRRLDGDEARNKQLTIIVKFHTFYRKYERTATDVKVIPGYKFKAGCAEARERSSG